MTLDPVFVGRTDVGYGAYDHSGNNLDSAGKK